MLRRVRASNSACRAPRRAGSEPAVKEGQPEVHGAREGGSEKGGGGGGVGGGGEEGRSAFGSERSDALSQPGGAEGPTAGGGVITCEPTEQ